MMNHDNFNVYQYIDIHAKITYIWNFRFFDFFLNEQIVNYHTFLCTYVLWCSQINSE